MEFCRAMQSFRVYEFYTISHARELAQMLLGCERLKNSAAWQPTKFVMTAKGLRASRDATKIQVSSRYIGDLQARSYERALREHARGELLDLGCGHVPLYEVYRGLITGNVCADWGGSLHVNPFIDVATDLNHNLPFEDARFDTVLMTDVLAHLAEPSHVVCE